MQQLKAVTNSILCALYPANVACFLCGREALLNERALCSRCAEAVHYCNGLPQPKQLDGLCCALLFDDVTSPAIHRLKYEHAGYLAKDFAALMQIPKDWQPDCIVPVPLYPKKERARGYNQSALLAEHIAQRYELPQENTLLARIRDTGSQTRLPPSERAKNVLGAFRSQPCDGRRILLIDDVCTTGSTLAAAAIALRQAGAAAVYALCACYRS